MTVPSPTLLRFGSFHGRLLSWRQEYTEALSLVFGVGLHPLTAEHDATRHFDLVIADPPAGADDSPLRVAPENVLRLGGTSQRPTVATDVLHAALSLDRRPIAMRLTVLRRETPFPALCVHFGVIIHKVLFYCDRLMLHAAAVTVDDRVCLFVGDKGAGKSTSTLALARSGGTVLGEDQVLLWRSGGTYLVSGSDERARLTERSERHFFTEPLPVPARDFAGTMKKEIAMKDYFASAPYRDFPPTRLIFPRVSGQFGLTRLKAQVALRRLMRYNGHFQRFDGARDQVSFLDFLAGFIATVSCWDLALSDDLSELDTLAERLRSA